MRNILVSLIAAALLAACSSPSQVKQSPAPSTSTKKGGYYLDDGPGDNQPANLEAVPDAVPRAESLHRYANRPYEVMGVGYTPIHEPINFRQQGIASWYGKRFHGKKTASGEIYNMYAMTAAHPTLPIPSYAKVTSVTTGKSVIVRINDRGPFHSDRVIDLSYTAAYKLGFVERGSAEVIVESVGPDTEPVRYDTAPANVAKMDPPRTPGLNQNRPGYYVQLGAFGNPDNAEKLLSQARRLLNIPAQLAQVRLVGTLHRVKLGPFADQDEARSWMEKSRDVLGISAITLID